MKFICCSSASCVCFCQHRPLGFWFCSCFSLSTNPLYPNCAVLNISRNTGKVTLLSWSKKPNTRVCLALWYRALSATASVCYSVLHRVEMYMRRHILPSLVLERTLPVQAPAVLWEQSREGDRAHTSRTSNPPALPKSIEPRSLRLHPLLAQPLS